MDKFIVGFALLFLDLILLPLIIVDVIWSLQHHTFDVAYILNNLNFFSIKEVLENPKLRNGFLIVQPVIILFFIIVLISSRKGNSSSHPLKAPPSAGNGEYGTSRFMKPKEIALSLNTWDYQNEEKPQRGGVLLGRVHSKPKVYLDVEDTHTLIIGTTRSGKSRRVILPTVWSLAKAGESMVLTDPKGELHERSKDYLESEGYKVILLDFREPKRGNHWNPVYPVMKAMKQGDMAKASELAWDIAHMFVYQTPSNGEPIWRDGAESVIASLILAVASDAENDNQKHLMSAYNILAELSEAVVEDDEVYIPIIEYIKSFPLDHPARTAFATARSAPSKTRGSFFTGVLAYLRLFTDPNIAFLTSKQDHELNSVGRVKTAVFLVIPDEKATRHILASLYVDQTYQALVELANQEGGRLPVRTHFLLDEFGNMPAITDFSSKITVSAGRGIRYTLVIQDLQQLNDKYSKSAKTITGNCHTWIYLLTTDVDTAKVLSAKTGDYTIRTTSESVSSNDRNNHSSSQSKGLAKRALLTHDEILRWPMDKSLVLKARNYPMHLDLPDLSQYPADQLLQSKGGVSFKKVEKVSIYLPIVTKYGVIRVDEQEEIKEKPKEEPSEKSKDFIVSSNAINNGLPVKKKSEDDDNSFVELEEELTL